MSRKFFFIVGAAALFIIGATPSHSTTKTMAFRFENFVRALETSGIDAQSRFYQFRGMNLASENGHRASEESQISVT